MTILIYRWPHLADEEARLAALMDTVVDVDRGELPPDVVRDQFPMKPRPLEDLGVRAGGVRVEVVDKEAIGIFSLNDLTSQSHLIEDVS